MKLYLVTGASASGKTTVSKILKERGYDAVNLDHGFAHFVNKKGKPAPVEEWKGSDPEWYKEHGWMLKEKEISDYIKASKADAIFLCGTGGMSPEFGAKFDKVFYLDCTIETILNRLKLEREHDYGKYEHHRQDLMQFVPKYRRQMIDQAAVMIDAEQPPEKIADDILSQL